ncbi:uncharacterized protein LOC142774975 [Rhipicephalus microplus]|uniref:uncharacterized protein LOC142774975 n=1 Tax=Rhipicephalus microplus TaxID=6941 RepID=UPI003F6BE31B
MWDILGIGVKSGKITRKLQHPVDSSRYLHFMSDFPHLQKCVRNTLLKGPLSTPNGKVSIEPVKKVYEMDCNNVTLKAMPDLTSVHLNSNKFEKMRVNYAFQLFGNLVITGLQFYKGRFEPP